jgi:hypothetical protein
LSTAAKRDFDHPTRLAVRPPQTSWGRKTDMGDCMRRTPRKNYDKVTIARSRLQTLQ